MFSRNLSAELVQPATVTLPIFVALRAVGVSSPLVPEVPVKAIVAVDPPWYVRFVAVVNRHLAPVPDKVYVAEPSLIVLVPVPEPSMALPVLVRVMLLLLTELSIVPVNAPKVKDCRVIRPPKLSVTVPPPDEASKVTASLEPGTDAPPAPPLDVDQWVVPEESHVPVPPTQNLDATYL